ncbi:unnamed protein product [Schistocephalus solidus]|uniref:Uncharacterized protein n=1 Tax=Schistocephalus solidus TaxID=70667 RepID=A0A3P7CE05_SCHSO|nr:unnamed protein product [Schistocephalus solidus]
MPVETDANKLVNFCCINYRIGEDPVPLKPDRYQIFFFELNSEYPDWLWSLRTDRVPPPLSEIEPDTYYYWRRMRRLHNRHLNKLAEIDGWHKKQHRDGNSHSQRVYGDLAYAIEKWNYNKSPGGAMSTNSASSKVA